MQPLLPGDLLDHACRNPLCVRPGVKHVRLATSELNRQNLANDGHPTVTGIRGVYLDKRRGKYGARVGHQGKMHHLGMFDTAEAAADAVKAKRLELHTYNEEDRA
jgi:LSD1 subclass zinc finger protein